MWALFTSTFGLLFWGAWRCCSRIVKALREKKAGPHTMFYLFTLLASLGTFCVSAISLIEPWTITEVTNDTDLSYFTYTRYDECIIGILLLLGFLELANHKKNKRFALIVLLEAVVYGFCNLILYINLLQVTGTTHYRSFCVAGIGFFHIFGDNFTQGGCALIGGGMALLLVLLCTFRKKQHKHRNLIIACLLCVAVFVPTGLYSAWIGPIISQNGKITCGNQGLYQTLGNYVGDYDVYCLLENTKNFRIGYELQVNLMKTHVHLITPEELPVNEGNGYFICIEKSNQTRYENSDYYLLQESVSYAVLFRGSEDAVQELQNQGAVLTKL